MSFQNTFLGKFNVFLCLKTRFFDEKKTLTSALLGTQRQRVANSLWRRIQQLRPAAGEHDSIVLLCGGDKSTQEKDIKAAKRLADEWSE